jgi:hypothetical protein
MTGETVPGGTSSELRDDAARALTALMQAVSEVRKDLRAYESMLEKAYQDLVAGDPVSDMLARYGAGEIRASFSDRLNGIERARSASRLSMWRLQLSEGANITDIAKAWGFSRQLISRALAGRARADSDSDSDSDSD